jgi:hypothetical protein
VWRQTARAVERPEVLACEVLSFGDSQCKMGFQPEVFQARTGRTAFNLALLNGSAPTSYFMLRRALDAGARPKAVVVDFAAELLRIEPYHNYDAWGDLLTARDGLELVWEARDPVLLPHWTLTRLLRSYKSRRALREAALAALGGRSWDTFDKTRADLRNARRNRGAMAQIDHPGPLPWLPARVPPWPDEYWGCHGLNQTYLTRFLDLAASRGIPVFWLMVPSSPGWQEHRDRFGLHDAFDGAVCRVLTRHAGVTVLDARRSGYDGVFMDPSHLDADGGRALTADVADVIARRLAGHPPAERWVLLPGYRRPRDGEAVGGAAVVRVEPRPTERVAALARGLGRDASGGRPTATAPNSWQESR